MLTLKKICEPIKKDLADYEVEFKKLLSSNVFLIDKVVKYIVRQKGKRLRPIFVILTSKMHNGVALDSRKLKAAAIMELLHTATLMHDDVVDSSPRRRGLPSVNSIWKNKVSILVGDLLLSKSLLAMLSLKSMRAYEIYSETAERMAQGELLGLERSKDYRMEEEVYFKLIGDKTASLLAAACQLGAVSSSENEEDIAAMKNFGENIGIAFQIKDDLLDIVGKEKQTGKPFGHDIRESKITLPLIFALKRAKKSESRRMIRKIKNKPDKQELNEIIAFVKDHGGIEYAVKTAAEYSQKAIKNLERYPDTPYKRSLTNLVEFVTTRES